MIIEDLMDPETGEEIEVAPLPKVLPLEALMGSQNIAEQLDPHEVATIGERAILEYEIDVESMKDWTKRMKGGIDLASLIKEPKSYPWPGAANVKYPLVTNAALMFNAKAYPAVCPSDQVVNCKVHGSDPQGKKAKRGERVSAHMSYRLGKDPEWEEGIDNLLVLLPIVGTVCRKVWQDIPQQRFRSRNIIPGKFVVNDKVTSLVDAPRCTEELPKYPSEIREKVLSGEWTDQAYDDDVGQDTEAVQDFIEQHRRLDLDGDGYTEPYIVTVHVKSRKVARIVADFDEKGIKRTWASSTTDEMGQQVETPGPIASIQRGSYFVAYHFLPSMTGGFWGTGFGLLLGDISETINGVINMMLDAGHAASLGGGFIGSDFRIKGGSQRMRPGEWKLASVTGSAIKDSIVPLTFPGPDRTLMELLGLLIEAGKEVANVKDVLTGEAGTATMPVGTVQALIEQGMAQFTAAFKRIFRSLKQEFKLIAAINAETTTPEEYNAFHDEMQPAPPQMGPDGQPAPQMGPDGQPAMVPMMFDPREDYGAADMDIQPVADPRSVTPMQNAAKGQFLLQMAKDGMVDGPEATKRVLESASIPDVEELAPKPDPMGEQMAQLQAALLEADGQLKAAQARLAEAQAQALQYQMPAEEMKAQAAAMKADADGRKSQSDGRIAEVKAASEEQKLAVEGQKAEREHTVALGELEIKRDDQELKHADLMLKAMKTDAEIDGMRAQQAEAPKRTEAEIGKIKADTKAALRPPPKPAAKPAPKAK